MYWKNWGGRYPPFVMFFSGGCLLAQAIAVVEHCGACTSQRNDTFHDEIGGRATEPIECN